MPPPSVLSLAAGLKPPKRRNETADDAGSINRKKISPKGVVEISDVVNNIPTSYQKENLSSSFLCCFFFSPNIYFCFIGGKEKQKTTQLYLPSNFYLVSENNISLYYEEINYCFIFPLHSGADKTLFHYISLLQKCKQKFFLDILRVEG